VGVFGDTAAFHNMWTGNEDGEGLRETGQEVNMGHSVNVARGKGTGGIVWKPTALPPNHNTPPLSPWTFVSTVWLKCRFLGPITEV
jgi:hypothetical protein